VVSCIPLSKPADEAVPVGGHRRAPLGAALRYTAVDRDVVLVAATGNAVARAPERQPVERPIDGVGREREPARSREREHPPRRRLRVRRNTRRAGRAYGWNSCVVTVVLPRDLDCTNSWRTPVRAQNNIRRSEDTTPLVGGISEFTRRPGSAVPDRLRCTLYRAIPNLATAGGSCWW